MDTVSLFPTAPNDSDSGYSHSFIPAPSNVELNSGQGPVTVPGAYTDLPAISKAHWERIATAFRLPGHYDRVVGRNATSIISIPRTFPFNNNFKGRLWMHVAMTHPQYGLPKHPAFALAATHFLTHNVAFAIMVGCSENQIDSVKYLMQGWGDAVEHPLLMLGICAELHSERLEHLTVKQGNVYQNLLMDVQNSATRNSRDKINWELIEDVRRARERGKRIEAEVNTTRLQISNAVSSSISKLLAQYKAQYDTSSDGSNSTPNQMTADSNTKSMPCSTTSSRSEDASGTNNEIRQALELKIDTTRIFEERLNDILSRLDRLSAECRISVEDISFTTDIIRSELARQEALSSAGNSRLGVVISLIALIYLPLTAVANNDWRDWRYRPVGKGNMPTTDSDLETRLPVVSGYIAIYFPVAIGLTIVTLTSFVHFYCQYGNDPLPDTKLGNHSSNNTQATEQNFKTIPGNLSRAIEKLRRSYHPLTLASSSTYLSPHRETAVQQGQPVPPTDEPPQDSQEPPLNRYTLSRPSRQPILSSSTLESVIESVSLRKSIQRPRSLPSVPVAHFTQQGNNNDSLPHSTTALELDTTGIAMTNEVSAQETERKILSDTPDHKMV
ncbi:hypothetical protein F5B22DRAFT_656319 [Xylaria bambusicola]|uniref:uncharacterized protein n=1 Tax=Xylaria bambusicola TaxID=326684 RepID=UPI0020073D6C|nr:uncharacterized protein F5B22DRAFT_656319 [Xylaria bambusicola]KAI0515137.1 hypothetical protein F5B22DRAFT_656319 [Xylaria bambusicola]